MGHARLLPILARVETSLGVFRFLFNNPLTALS